MVFEVKYSSGISLDFRASFIFCRYSLPLTSSIQVMYGMGKLKVKSIGCFLSIFSLSKVVAKELLGNVAPTYM